MMKRPTTVFHIINPSAMVRELIGYKDSELEQGVYGPQEFRNPVSGEITYRERSRCYSLNKYEEDRRQPISGMERMGVLPAIVAMMQDPTNCALNMAYQIRLPRQLNAEELSLLEDHLGDDFPRVMRYLSTQAAL